MARGDYTSINDIPAFADYVAEYGPFDPNKIVPISQAASGQYTPYGVNHNTGDEDGRTTFWLDMSALDDIGEFEGVYMYSVAQFSVDFNGQRYIYYITPAAGNDVIYSVNLELITGLSHRQDVVLPADHPLLMCFRPDGIPPSIDKI